MAVNFMDNFREKLMQFMYGRYGVDQLYYALFVMYCILILLGRYIQSPILSIIAWAILIWMIYRSFSRNIYSRRRENEVFLKILNPVRKESALTIRRLREIKTHRFRKCPYCKAVLRLPIRKGKHAVDCPNCHKEFKVNIIV